MARALNGIRKLTGGEVGQAIGRTNQAKVLEARKAASSMDLTGIKGTPAIPPASPVTFSDSVTKHNNMVDARAQKAADSYSQHLTPDRRAKQNMHAARQGSRRTKEQWETQRPEIENNRMLDQAHRMNSDFTAGRARERDGFITDVRDRLQGSSVSRETVEASYDKLSKQDGWGQMGKNDRRQAVMNDGMDTAAYNMAHSRMSAGDVQRFTANGTLHKEIESQVPGIRSEMQQNIAARRSSASTSSAPIGSNTGGANGRRRSSSVQQEAINSNAALVDGDFATDGLGRGGKRAVENVISNSKFAENNFDSIANDGVRNKIMRDFRMDEQELGIYQGLTGPQRKEFYKDKARDHASNPGMMNHMIGNKVPQIAVGGLATAGLVSAMSNNRGQQSNSQLYGQQQPYY